MQFELLIYYIYLFLNNFYPYGSALQRCFVLILQLYKGNISDSVEFMSDHNDLTEFCVTFGADCAKYMPR